MELVKELYQLHRSPDIISVRIFRLRWAGHVERMSGEDIFRRIMDCKPEGIRRIGRPKLRWIAGVMMDIKKLGVMNWRTVSRDREAGRKGPSGSRYLHWALELVMIMMMIMIGR